MQWPTITKETTLDEVFEIHKKIWEETLRIFEETGIPRNPKTLYESDCVLCQYAYSRPVYPLGCPACPADWNSFACCNSRVYSIYAKHYEYCLDIGPKYSKLHHDDIVESIKAIRDIPRKKI